MGTNNSTPVEKKATSVGKREKKVQDVLEEVAKVQSLEELMDLCDENGFKQDSDYKAVKQNIKKLIEHQGRARDMDLHLRKGEEFGQLVRDYIFAVKLVTDSIPAPRSYQRAKYTRAGKFSKYYNKIMIGHAKDFKAFAGSLKLTVVTRKVINEALFEAWGDVKRLKSEENGEHSDLLDTVLTITDALPKLISGTANYVESTDSMQQDWKELEREVKKICESRIEETSIAKLAADLASYREDFIRYCNDHPCISEKVKRISEIAKSSVEAETLERTPICLLNLESAKSFPDLLPISKLNSFLEQISSAAEELINVVSKEANSIVEKLTEPTKKWREKFSNVSRDQIYYLKHNRSVKGELDKNNMSILWVSWSDVGRQKGSCVGPNITDMQFFAIPPLALRPAAPSYLDLDDKLFCNFPAVRSPNFTDEVDIRSADTYSFKVRDIYGDIKEVTMKYFLKHIGEYITDFEPEDDWGDAIDSEKEKMQVASQFSVLPLLECADYKVDVGISAFGYQQKNLHIVIGPDGDIGWAPEGNGYKRIFFRDTAGILDAIADALAPNFAGSKYISALICRFALGYDELRAIALVPEDREKVSKAFFKKPPENESIEEEAKRYEKVENKLVHIQIEMERGDGGVGDYSQASMFSCYTIKKMARTLESKKGMLGMVDKTRADIMKSHNEMVDSHNLDYNAVSHQEQQAEYSCEDECDDDCDDVSYEECMGLQTRMASGIAECAVLHDGDWRRTEHRRAKRPSPPNLGLLLARVKMGDSVGRANDTDTIPHGSKRTKGIAVRVTEMFYSVARNAEFTKPRIYRFMQQMSFAKRAGKLIHGSVVTGVVNID